MKPENLIMQSIKEQCVYDNLADHEKSHWFLFMQRLTAECVKDGKMYERGMQPISEECNDKVISEINDN
jgi:hypothetical protein